MARYRKVEVATWSDARFLSLSSAQPNGQTLWLYLLCGPRTTTFPGLVVAREEVIASDLGWTLKGLREGYGECLGKGLVKADWNVGLVFLRKALFDGCGDPRDTARPSNPNVLKNWALSWELIPECELKFEYLDQLELFANRLGETFPEAFRKAFAKPLAKRSAQPSPNQESGVRSQEAGTGMKNSARPSVGGSSLEILQAKVDALAPRANARRRPKPSEPTPDERDSAMRVLGKLSSRNGVRYTGSDEHVGLIVRHLRSGVSELELRYVVGYCAAELEWADDADMAKYLRPETLFGPKTISKYLDPARTWASKLPDDNPQPSAGAA